jgi:sigma-B regulation protein RsbU (phosphoserine phosphatase)
MNDKEGSGRPYRANRRLFETRPMNVSHAKILVVDDVAENRDLLLRRLQRLGIDHIDQAENGVQALAALDGKNYDLMLLDIMMPEMDGFAVLDVLRQNGRATDLPVIVISAMNEIDAVVRCIECGAEDFLFKPFNPVLLRARVLATLEKKILRDRTRDELRRKQAELNEARTLQLALVPAPMREARGDRALAIDVHLEPAKEVGGDLVDHFRIGDDLVAFLVGDVSDKGAGAALMMARTHSMFRSLAARPDAAVLFSDPAKAMNIVNAALAEGNSSCMFVTAFLGVLDLSTLRLAYVRAGHVPPFQWNGTSAIGRLEEAGGPPLGLVEDLEYKQHSVSLSQGESLLVVTDGFTEASDPAGQLFGDARIAAFLGGDAGADPQALQALVREVHAFEAGLPQFDDMAAVLLSFRPLAVQ